MSRAPPPRATIFGCRLLASATISSRCAFKRRNRRQRIAHVDELHLADQDRVGRAGFESAGQPRGARRGRQSGDDRRFFDTQRHDIVATVDQKIERETERQTQHADDVFDHLVGDLDPQRVIAGGEQRDVVVGQQTPFVQRIEALTNRHPEKIRNSGGTAILRRRL